MTHAGPLYELFDAVRDIKPTSVKLMPASKALYLLLPNLIPPMDSTYTAPFLTGRRGLPRGLDKTFLVDCFSTFSGIAKGVGRGRLTQLASHQKFSVRLGLGRVIDFGICGYEGVLAGELE